MSDLPEPGAGPEDAIVRVRLAGICRTDLEICRGYLGFQGTPGHEWVGEVASAPDPALVGARVVGEINFGCGACDWCRAGLARHCPTRRVQGIVDADGAFADLLAVPVRVLHRIPGGLPDQTAVFAEPLAAAFEILEQLGDVGGRRAVVIGDGKLGLLVAQVLAGAGAHVALAGRHREKLALGARLGLDTGRPRPGADLVVDATGSPTGLAAALDLVRPRGTVVLKTTIAAEHRIDLARAVVNEVSVVGSRCGPFAPALDALASGGVQVAPLLEAVYPLADAVAAFAHAARSGALKVLVAPG
jgi:threonine dehydrogenase-like Zn-dependent dehydrogenase